LEITNPKHQISNKHQCSKYKTLIGYWNLEIIWDLGFGYWNL